MADTLDQIEEALSHVNLNQDGGPEVNSQDSILEENIQDYVLEENNQDSVLEENQGSIPEENVKISETKSVLTENEQRLTELLKVLECPFTWKPENDASNYRDGLTTINKIEEKDEEIADEEGEFQWRRYILKLVLIYEHFQEKDFTKSAAILRDAEQLALFPDIHGDNIKFYESVVDAVSHVLNATKAHILFHNRILNETERTIKKIKKVMDMNDTNKAAMYAIQAAVWMEYGFSGTKQGLELIEKALELDQSQGEWLFLKGKCLGRIRRIACYNEVPSHMEMKCLEEAVEKTEKAAHMVFLAQSYREASFRVFSLHRDRLSSLKDKLHLLNQRAVQYYMKALERRGTCSHVNARCALGFLKLPYPFRNVELSQKCIEKAMALSPNNAMINHVAAKIYEYNNMLEDALKHYKISGEQGAFGSWMDYIRLTYHKNNAYNPIPDFEMLLETYKELPLQIELYSQIASYNMFIKNNFSEAVKYWDKAMALDSNSNKLRVHKCELLKMKLPVNVYELLLDEARLLESVTDSKEQRELCKRVISKCAEKVPDLMNERPLPRRQMVLKDVEANMNSRSRSRFPRGNRGRGSGNRGRGFRNRGRGRGGNWNNRGGQQGGQNMWKNRSRDSSHDSHYSSESKDRRGSNSRNYSNRGRGNVHYSSRDDSQNRSHSNSNRRNYRDKSNDYNKSPHNTGHSSKDRNYHEGFYHKNRSSSSDNRQSERTYSSDRNRSNSHESNESKITENRYDSTRYVPRTKSKSRRGNNMKNKSDCNNLDGNSSKQPSKNLAEDLHNTIDNFNKENLPNNEGAVSLSYQKYNSNSSKYYYKQSSSKDSDRYDRSSSRESHQSCSSSSSYKFDERKGSYNNQSFSRKHYNNPRGNSYTRDRSASHERGSSTENRADKDKNWRSGPRNFEEGNDVCDTGFRPRTNSFGGPRMRTESTSSRDSYPEEVAVSWREGCQGATNSRENNEHQETRTPRDQFFAQWNRYGREPLPNDSSGRPRYRGRGKRKY